jgi:hypothetical protein
MTIILHEAWTCLKIIVSPMSFSWSRDHPYSKLLSWTTTVGTHRGAGVKIHYVEINDLHDQYLSQWEPFRQSAAASRRSAIGDGTLTVDGDTSTDDSDTSTVDGSTIRVCGDTSMVNWRHLNKCWWLPNRRRPHPNQRWWHLNSWQRRLLVGGGHIKLQCSASSDAALSLTRRVHRQDFTSAGHEQPRL